jgi:hypothetical protein
MVPFAGTTNGPHLPSSVPIYEKVDQLSDEDQKALLVVLDSLVKRIRSVMTE